MIPEYKITKRDVEDADLLLRKLDNTEWEIRDLYLQLLSKYAHMSETARSLKYLPAMEKVSELVDDIARDNKFRFESGVPDFNFYRTYYSERIESIHKHLYELSLEVKEDVVVQGVMCEETNEPEP